jgi:hypothetical protein
VKGSLSWSVEVAVVTDVAVIWRSRSPEESERLQVNSRTHLQYARAVKELFFRNVSVI